MKETNEIEIMQKIEKKEGFVLVLFSSLLCGKCKIAEDYLEKVLPQLPEFPVYKCNIDYSSKIVDAYHVTSAPSFKLFVDGEVIQTLFGLRSSDDLYYTIKNYVKTKENYTDVWSELLH
jgi:thioredoxin-like negative regulator of GroEL